MAVRYLFRRGLSFATFLGTCLSISLLATALATHGWIEAKAYRTANPEESDGRIQLGLFSGKRELNVAYGWRTYDMKVLDALYQDPEFLITGLWAATVACLAAALLCSLIVGVLAIINTVTIPAPTLCGAVGLCVTNGIAFACTVGAIVTWVIQYFLRLEDNVLLQEDKDNFWTTAGLAKLSYSFWFVVAAGCIFAINIVLVILGEQSVKERNRIRTEKPNGVTLLY
ncbi:uncharacterized protein LOC136026892 [Artemia franciscana]|uniref:Clarin-3 n=1 Tax=Artemia franciscana TaxID=6661 RepID=A0AA88HQJ5_ARTSF|nr:hypothetical protein QYM36_013553 [Artemia franciscana]KAK2709906.1 hypothetical protein QYM36_013553 [Artemia franciscana]KAK2709907.1 hypothetical protein QYM36_013553 [Artemia franciscana]KAK2709908.1 hypothetical protein QYM36_013553 [Artemia franciscana]